MGTSEEVASEPAAGTPRRRQRSIAERRQIVEETFAAGASVARVSRAHGVNANQVFNWRRLYQRGMLGGNTGTALLPVKVADDPLPAVQVGADAPTRPQAPSPVLDGTIQLQLPKGRLRIEGAADPTALRVVLECLLG